MVLGIFLGDLFPAGRHGGGRGFPDSKVNSAMLRDGLIDDKRLMI